LRLERSQVQVPAEPLSGNDLGQAVRVRVKPLTHEPSRRPVTARVSRALWLTLTLKAKFHDASWFGAGSELARSWFEPDSVMKFDFEPAPNQLV